MREHSAPPPTGGCARDRRDTAADGEDLFRRSLLPRSRTISRTRAIGVLGVALTMLALTAVRPESLRVAPEGRTFGVPVAAAQGSGDELTIVGQFGGDVTAVAAEGNRVFVGIGPRVAVIDVSDPSLPRLLGETDVLPGVVVDMAYEDGFVYAIAGGIVAVNVGNPQNPVQVGYLRVGEYDPLYGWVGPAHIDVSDGFAYLAGNVSYQVGRLHIVDVTDPRNPTLASRFEEYTATGVAVYGSLAYLSLRACFGSNCTPDHVAMLVLDVTDPYMPKVLGDFAEPRGATHVVAAGTSALLLGSRCPLVVVDASNPGAPRLDDCVTIQSLRRAVDAAVAGSIAYVLSDAGTVFSFDLSAGARPLDTVSVASGGAAIATSGGRVFSAHDVFGLGTVDASQPANLRRLSVVQRPGSFVDVVVDGSIAYVAGLYTGLHVIDATNTNKPVQIGAAAASGGLSHLAKIGATVYGVGLSGSSAGGATTVIRSYDVSTASQPRDVGLLTVNDLTDMVTDGRLLYVASATGLQILDPAADAAHPVLVGTYSSPRQSQFTSVAVGEGVVYLIMVSSSGRNNFSYEVRVVDVSTPSSPSLEGVLLLADNVTGYRGGLEVSGMAVQGTNVYIANSMGYYSGYVQLPFPLNQYVMVVDASRADRPELVGTWGTYERLAPNGVMVSDRWLYLGTWAGVRVLDVIVPGYPKAVARLDTPEIDAEFNLGMDLDARGRLFLARLDAGLLIVDADVPPPPTPTSGPSPTRTSTGQPPPTLTPGAATATNDPFPGPTRRPTQTPSPTLRPGETPEPRPTIGPPPTRTRGPGRPSPTATSLNRLTPSATTTGIVPGPSATPTDSDNTPVVVPTGSVTITVLPGRTTTRTATSTGPRPSITPDGSATTEPGPQPNGIYLPFVLVERR